MTPEEVDELVRLRRARDFVDREYASPIDVAAMARSASMSTAHFSRRFRSAYGETPYSYLMTRRVERAKSLLRQGASVTEACMAVGCSSLGSFSTRFTALVGETPSIYRDRDHAPLAVVPPCVSKLVTRPRRLRKRPPPRGGLGPKDSASSRIEEARTPSLAVQSPHETHRVHHVHPRRRP